MNWLTRIFKREVGQNIVNYNIKCETIIKKPKKGEVILLKLPDNTSPEILERIADKFKDALDKKEGIMAISGFEIVIGKVKMEKNKK